MGCVACRKTGSWRFTIKTQLNLETSLTLQLRINIHEEPNVILMCTELPPCLDIVTAQLVTREQLSILQLIVLLFITAEASSVIVIVLHVYYPSFWSDDSISSLGDRFPWPR